MSKIGARRAAPILALVVAAASTCAAFGQPRDDTPTLHVTGTLFRVVLPDGRVLTSPDLVGALFEVADESGRLTMVRIEAVALDPSDPAGDVWLHRFSVPDAGGGGWRNLCSAAPDGTEAGFPIATGGAVATVGEPRTPPAFTLTCTSGAVGKCVRLGYKPWRDVAGVPLADYHQACVRALRADYGGDGISFTRDGTRVDLFDRLGIQQPEPSPGELTFEAAWNAEGAACVRRPRIAEIVSLTDLGLRYPRLVERTGAACSETMPALIWNRS
jgi:hypothetical protein